MMNIRSVQKGRKGYRALYCAAFLWPWLLTGPAHAIDSQSDASPGTLIFAQPVLTGVASNFHVPIAEHKYPSAQAFNLLLWQANPNRPDGQLVSTKWNAGDMTGFYPGEPLSQHQAAFLDKPGASTVQIEGDTVGVYLNSKDLTKGSAGDKMMITPAFKSPTNQRIYPFATPGKTLMHSLELQVPVARDLCQQGNMTYVVADFTFEDRQTHTRISYGLGLFHHGTNHKPDLKKIEVGVYDEPSHCFQVGNPIASASRVLKVLPGSSLAQNQPWRGWKVFHVAITGDNFKTALQSLKEKAPGFTASKNPADYALIEWHLNAELKFGSGPAELGWSMRRARVTLVP